MQIHKFSKHEVRTGFGKNNNYFFVTRELPRGEIFKMLENNFTQSKYFPIEQNMQSKHTVERIISEDAVFLLLKSDQELWGLRWF